MTKVIRIQPSAHVDHITADGAELTKLPYPYFVTEDGKVGRQDFWQGKPYRVVGFQRDLAVPAIDLRWFDAFKDPQRAVGMYVVISHQDGNWYTVDSAVSEMEVLETEQG
jgi:hypothetical protein